MNKPLSIYFGLTLHAVGMNLKTSKFEFLGTTPHFLFIFLVILLKFITHVSI